MSKKQFSPEKWNKFGGEAQRWWGTLSIEDKIKYRNNYDKYVEHNIKTKTPTPDYNTTSHMRISQLGMKHIYRIWVFKDRNI